MELHAPAARIDGFPVAVTVDLAVGNDLSDMGTGIDGNKDWTQREIETAAARALPLVEASRRH